MLTERHRFNRIKKFGKGSIPLNTPELNHVNSTLDLSHTFFQRIFPWWRARGVDIAEGVSRAEEERRSMKHTEQVVENHFFGEYGLEKELIAAGVMTPDTKVRSKVADADACCAYARRLLNADETPQPLDVPQKGRRAKVAKRKGKAVRQTASLNKETITVMMTWDAAGWNYGVQLVTKRKWATEDLVVEAPAGECTFDDRVDLTRLQTRSCLPVHAAEGMQTEETFLKYIHRLDAWISQRSAVEAATGGTPIERP
eukprot:scaffold325929_cov59-Tisochrysis_lutea.AAC.1